MGAHNTMGSLKLFKHCCAASVTPQEIPHVLHRKFAPQVTPTSILFALSPWLQPSSPLLGYVRCSTFWIRKHIQLSGIDLIFPVWLKFPVLLQAKHVASLGASWEHPPSRAAAQKLSTVQSILLHGFRGFVRRCFSVMGLTSFRQRESGNTSALFYLGRMQGHYLRPPSSWVQWSV